VLAGAWAVTDANLAVVTWLWVRGGTLQHGDRRVPPRGLTDDQPRIASRARSTSSATKTSRLFEATYR
jgi:hypothetical protein